MLSSPTRQASGSSDIGCSSSSITRRSRSSIACRAPTRRAGRRPDRIHRRTVSGFLPSRSAASATVNMREMVRQAPDPRVRDRAAYGDQERPAMTNPAHVDASADSAARQHVRSPRHPHESRQGTRDIGCQSALDGTPRHRLSQHRFDRRMDLPSPHRPPGYPRPGPKHQPPTPAVDIEAAGWQPPAAALHRPEPPLASRSDSPTTPVDRGSIELRLGPFADALQITRCRAAWMSRGPRPMPAWRSSGGARRRSGSWRRVRRCVVRCYGGSRIHSAPRFMARSKCQPDASNSQLPGSLPDRPATRTAAPSAGHTGDDHRRRCSGVHVLRP